MSLKYETATRVVEPPFQIGERLAWATHNEYVTVQFLGGGPHSLTIRLDSGALLQVPTEDLERIDAPASLLETFVSDNPQIFASGSYLRQATSEQRKGIPLCTGLIDYFPDALAAIAEHSRISNDKHNPGEPLHWAREKSPDHANCIARHLMQRGTLDKGGTRHSTALAWRALALLQLELEAERKL